MSSKPCKLSKQVRRQHVQALLAENNLPGNRPSITKDSKIAIVGAGMSGLYAAMILESLGFTNYEILEANNRPGGRIYTHHFGDQWSGQHDYFDVGAMRFPEIPISDRLIGTKPWSLLNKLGLEREEVMEPYYLSSDNCFLYFNGTRLQTGSEQEEPATDPLHFGDQYHGGKGSAVPDEFAAKDYSYWLDPVYKEFKLALAENFDDGFNKLMASDHYSTRGYLLTKEGLQLPKGLKRLPASVVSWFETMDSASGLYDLAFSESVMDSLDFDYPTSTLGVDEIKWWRFKEGSEVLVKKMLQSGIKTPQYSTTVTKITPVDPKGCKVAESIQLHFDNSTSRQYDHVISTVPLSVFRTLNTEECNLSYKKRLALRTLHYDQSVKVAIQFKTRWWETKFGIYGGKSSTDLPVRTIVYPSYGFKTDEAGNHHPGDGSGVLIVSYTWAQDAARIGALAAKDPHKLKDICLSNLATVHGLEVRFLEENFQAIFAHDWYQDKHAQGAFALYGPGQFSSLFAAIVRPEMDQRLHFAGEATSVHHAWIVGSLNSAYRTVWEMLDDENRQKLSDLWGNIEEVEKPEPSEAKKAAKAEKAARAAEAAERVKLDVKALQPGRLLTGNAFGNAANLLTGALGHAADLLTGDPLGLIKEPHKHVGGVCFHSRC
eukprot:TRINITY_DN15310_c0_g1_i1.p1 TRINITY_DN15310_c0_g1~~TRINITY_DN15310_c0_g1_i1.p1  ORF type:complete len:658 (-),score=101.61 TRINITY_DN15310_c0_g1_i1:129-2102(-)